MSLTKLIEIRCGVCNCEYQSENYFINECPQCESTENQEIYGKPNNIQKRCVRF